MFVILLLTCCVSDSPGLLLMWKSTSETSWRRGQPVHGSTMVWLVGGRDMVGLVDRYRLVVTASTGGLNYTLYQFRQDEQKTEIVKEVDRERSSKEKDKGGFSVRRDRSRSRSGDRKHDKDKKKSERDKDRKKSRSRSRERHKKSHKRSRSRERRRSRSKERHHHKDRKDRDRDYSEELRRFKDDSSKSKKHSR